MKELITIEQANLLMYAVLIGAPVIGLVWGVIAKQVKAGLAWGVGIGIGNLILWKVYNAITDHLGLDTVKNLVVNLALFMILGLVLGAVHGMLMRNRSGPDMGRGDTSGGAGVALAGAPSGRGAGAARTIDEANEPPRDAN